MRTGHIKSIVWFRLKETVFLYIFINMLNVQAILYSIKKFHKYILFIALIVYSISAYNSHGYIQEDEHFQIIEFARMKLNQISPDQVAWEYQAEVRSGLQPFIAYTVFSIAYKAGVTDPYTLAFLLRLLTVFFAIFCIYHFTIAAMQFVEDRFQKIFILLSYLLWFLPFVNVRFSSETWGGLFFLLALSAYLKNKTSYLITGLLLSAAFLCRFQTSILSAGFIFWLIFIRKEKNIAILKIFISALSGLFIGIGIDYWLYKKLTISFVSYFTENVIHNVASQFGTSPWYYYINVILIHPFILLGIIIIFSLIILAIYDRRNIFIWVVIPFIIVHSLIPHKEARFLLPLVNFIPIILIMAFQKTVMLFPEAYKKYSKQSALLFYLFLLINSIGLIAVASRTCDSKVFVTRYIQHTYPDKKVRLIFSRVSNVSEPNLPATFYENKNVEMIRIDSIQQFNSSLIDTSKINLLVCARNENFPEKAAFIEHKKEVQSIPEWIVILGLNSKTLYRSQVFELYHFKIPDH